MVVASMGSHHSSRKRYVSHQKPSGFFRWQVPAAGEISMRENTLVPRGRGAAVCVAAALCCAGAGAQAPHAAAFGVDSTADLPDVNPGDHLCRTDAATCTLRAAVQEANADGGANTIFVPRGHYRLRTPPTPEAGAPGQDDPAKGDLDITAPLTIRGAGARRTIV